MSKRSHGNPERGKTKQKLSFRLFLGIDSSGLFNLLLYLLYASAQLFEAFRFLCGKQRLRGDALRYLSQIRCECGQLILNTCEYSRNLRRLRFVFRCRLLETLISGSAFPLKEINAV